MADKVLKIEVLYDDNGATAKLKQLDNAVDGVGKTMDTTTTPATSKMSGMLKTALVGAAVTAVYEVGKLASELIRMSEETVRVADRTGLTTKAVQQLGFVASQSGNTIEQITTALGQMQNRLASGDKSALAAVKALGLSMQQLNDLNPDEQFYAIGKAIASIEDPARRTQLAMDLFGRSGAAVLPALIADMEKLRDEAPVMSDATVRSLERAGDTLDWLGLKAKVTAASVFNFFVDTAKLAAGSEWVKTFGDAELPVARFSRSMQEARVAAFDFADRGAQPLTLSLREADQIAKELTVTTPRVTTAVRDLGLVMSPLAQYTGTAALQFTLLDGALVQIIPDAGKAAKQFEFLGWQVEPLASRALPSMIAELPTVAGNLTTTGKAAEKTGLTFREKLGQGVEVLSLLSRTAEMAGHRTTSAILSAGAALAQGFASGGPWGAVMAGVGSVVSWVGDKLFKTEGRKVNDLRDAFISAAGGLHELNVKAQAAGMTLDALLRADTVAEYEAAVASLNTELEKTAALQAELTGLQEQLAGRQVMDWKTAEEIIGKYGGTLDSLGQKFVAAKQSASWKEVWDDWQTLIDMGADVGGTLFAMKGKIQDLVQESLRVGTEIPDQFKPLIANLIETGQLFDVNGKAITDISQLKFGAPLVSEVDKLIAKIDELVSALTNKLTPAIGDIPTDIKVNVGYEYEPYAPPESGGFTGGEVPEYATGGVGNFGAGTLAMLHGQEAVVPLTKPSAVGAAIVGGLMAGVEAKLDQLLVELPNAMARAARDGMLVRG